MKDFNKFPEELPILFKKLESTSVQIVTLSDNMLITKVASGFLYTYDGIVYVITNAHVILVTTVTNPLTKLYAGLIDINGIKGNNRILQLNIVGIDATSDIAVCGFDISNEFVPDATLSNSIKFANSRKQKEGDFCFTIGNPMDADSTSLSSGIIRDPAFMAVKGIFIQEQIFSSLDIYPATSGSAVYNSCGYVIGIVSFLYRGNAAGSGSTNNLLIPGFAGGCSSYMMKPIINNLIKRKQSTKLAHIRGPPYFTYRKGYLGDITWLGATPANLITYYPNNYQNLLVRGFIITGIKSDYNILSKPVEGAPIMIGDIITAVQAKNGSYVKIGTQKNEYAIGSVLWQYDPNKKPVVNFKVIHSPDTNTLETITKLRLDINYIPANETPPSSLLIANLASTILSQAEYQNRCNTDVCQGGTDPQSANNNCNFVYDCCAAACPDGDQNCVNNICQAKATNCYNGTGANALSQCPRPPPVTTVL